MYGQSNTETFIPICKIDSQWELAVCLRQLKQPLCLPGGWGMGREMEGRVKRKGTYVYLWLIHADV